MVLTDLKILIKKIGVSILIYALPLGILAGGLYAITHFLTN
nr:hypothetical protein [uncultured Arsenicibacter sp.]